MLKNRGYWEHETGHIYMYRGGAGFYKLSKHLGVKDANYWKVSSPYDKGMMTSYYSV